MKTAYSKPLNYIWELEMMQNRKYRTLDKSGANSGFLAELIMLSFI